jgi:hypothetical protein
MSKIITVNGTNFKFPETNENPNWAKAFSDWATAINASGNTIVNGIDLVVGSQTIDNNASTTAITDLIFSPLTIRAAHISYVVYRKSTSTPTGTFETGIINLTYDTNGTTNNQWFLSQNKAGNGGITFTVSDAGQVSYTSTNINATGYSGKISFSVKTFKQANFSVYIPPPVYVPNLEYGVPVVPPPPVVVVPPTPPPSTSPSISSFTTNKSSITLGDNVTFSFSTSNATSLIINPGNFNVTNQTSMLVTPTVTTTYTLTASNGVSSVSSSITILVTASTPTPTPTPTTKTRGIRIDPGYFYDSHPGQTPSQIAISVISAVKNAKADIIYLYAYNATYGAYYPTTYSNTIVEPDLGALNIFNAVVTQAKFYGLKVVAVVPLNNFKHVWTNNSSWRVKQASNVDYVPNADTYLLSASVTAYKNWYVGFINDLITRNPNIDWVEAVEPNLDLGWTGVPDQNNAALTLFNTQYPGSAVGSANWLNFRAQELVNLIALFNQTVHAKNKESCVVQTWTCVSAGTLMAASDVKNGSGFDFVGVSTLTGTSKTDHLIAEFIWQQWKSEYGTSVFTPEWISTIGASYVSTLQAAGNKSDLIVHVEISPFTGAYNTTTPTKSEFSRTMVATKTLTNGVSVYDYDQIRVQSAFTELSQWSTTPITPPPPTPDPTPDPTPPPPPPAPSPTAVYGVTIDSISSLSAIVTSLGNLSRKPTTRIVFDENVAASYYVNACAQIQPVSFIMGEILDSYYMSQITTAQYGARTTEYMNALGNTVDIWEIGNEINGEWLGDIPSTVAKMNLAYNLVKAAGKKTALNLYYNKNCDAPAANEMFLWAQNNISSTMKQNLDYVFFSYYEDDCYDLQPDWPPIFQRLSDMFPNSKIGFGEVGTIYANRKVNYINRYYNMNISVKNYVGGYFWWYYKQDCVPYTTTYWNALNEAIK